MRRATRAIAAAAVVVVGAGSAIAIHDSTAANKHAAGAATAPPKLHTVQVVRRDLVDTTSVSGTVTYGDSRTLKVSGTSSSSSAASSSSASSASRAAGATTATTAAATTSGIITALPSVGSLFSRGQTVFEVDGAPGPALLYGSRPMWRTLQSGITDGIDVLQLEFNLAALGFTDNGAMVVDNHFDSATTAAIDAWQTARGVTVNGAVAPSDVVYQPGPIRVATLTAAVGDSASGAIMTVTDTTRLVHVALDPTNTSYVTIGGTVTITLADNSTTVGRYFSLGTVANVATSGQGNNASTTTTLDLWIALVKPPANLLDDEPVTVALVTDRAKNVLAVPASALLALAEGGYGLEKVQPDGTTKLVGVQTGKFADDWVQVTGDIAEGDQVVSA